ncbi:glycerol dehydratase [Roseovarius spongiae]|uniref:Glycerol dehydratase n=1 Tax=Roseovarius spongiae TaxID=2320272 RepID=A0A3A8B3H4_9RHOB|nr:diol dehydratase small subunit [Roseovarius spongiae]RKF15312.1 glycerol dehydratase [Roseovarius spongiae]
MKTPTVADYPLAEKHGDDLRGPRGRTLDEVTLEAVMEGRVGIEDLRITPEALHAQAAIARDAGRETLARNFERAAELIDVPQDVIMQTYEMLRPGRVRTHRELAEQAEMLRRDYGARQIAEFVERAADIYLRRGLVERG